MSKTVLILGASGKIGRHSARAFDAAGWTVKRFDRTSGDMTRDARGVDMIVNGMNPANYHDWANIIPDITRRVIAAAKASGATVILPGNVYHFGDTPEIWSEKTAPNPVSRKGAIRLAMEQTYRDSGVQTIILRAGNFIDPDRQGCIMSQMYLREVTAGRFVLPGPEDVRQAMCYLPDWARAAVALAEMRGELGLFEDVPFPGHTLTARQIRSGVEAILGNELKTRRFPWWIMTALSPIWELARELREMRYLWNTDHGLSGERFRSLLPEFQDTDLEVVLRSALPPQLMAGQRDQNVRPRWGRA